MTSGSGDMLRATGGIPLSRIAITIIAVACAWTVAQWVAQPNLDRYHDMLESFAWSQTFEWGSFKHPPFFAWITGVWFSVMPRTDFAFKLLSYTNVAVGLLGVAVLARHAGLGRFALAAVVLLCLCLPYTTLAAKFNANSQLLSVWPWAAAALFGSLLYSGLRGFAWSTLLGLTCAAAMLSKYYSGVLLLALFIAALAHPEALRWFASPRPWWALGLTLLALTPHALWLKASGFAMLDYAFDQGGGQVNWSMTARFAIAPFLYWGLGLIACVVVIARSRTPRPRGSELPAMFIRAWRPQGWRDSLFWLALTPWAVSLVFGLAGVVELSTPWAIPVGFAFPLLWLRNLGPLHDPRPVAPLESPRFMGAVLCVVLVGSAALAAHSAFTGQRDYYRPSAALAQAIAADWTARHPDRPLGWSAGAWPDTAMMAFYVSPNIRALPGLPDSREAALAPHRGWATEAGVLLCTDALEAARESCAARMRAWLTERGLPADGRTLSAHRSGWRFPMTMPQSVLVFDVPPQPASRGRAR